MEEAEERPKCKCHGEAMHRNRGGWRCAVKTQAYGKAHYTANRERTLARARAFYETNREQRRAYFKAYHKANRDKRSAAWKAYYEARPTEWHLEESYRKYRHKLRKRIEHKHERIEQLEKELQGYAQEI